MRLNRSISRFLLPRGSRVELAVAFTVLAACSPEPADDTGGSSSSSGGSDASSGPSTGVDPTTGAPCTTQCQQDLPSLECDLLAQDCPAGSKCSSNGDLSFCAPLDPDPGVPGEACTITAKGVDSCAAGAFCWIDGLCHRLCEQGVAPGCPMGSACVNGDGFAQICVASCEPMLQNCPVGQECVIPSSNVPVCAPDISGAGGEAGDVCEFVNGCDPGNQCDQKHSVPDCAGDSCCTPFCDFGIPEPICPAGQKCLLFYPVGTAPAGLEFIGTCGV